MCRVAVLILTIQGKKYQNHRVEFQRPSWISGSASLSEGRHFGVCYVVWQPPKPPQKWLWRIRKYTRTTRTQLGWSSGRTRETASIGGGGWGINEALRIWPNILKVHWTNQSDQEQNAPSKSKMVAQLPNRPLEGMFSLKCSSGQALLYHSRCFLSQNLVLYLEYH